MSDFFAHSKNEVNKKHLLEDHLSSVSELVRCFSKGLSWTEEAVLAGQLHDLGKYGDLFQARLRGEVSGLDHWSTGAWMALVEYHSIAGALAIQGHHIGLQQGNKDALRGMNPVDISLRHPFNLKLSDNNLQRLKQRFATDGLSAVKTNKTVINVNKGIENPIASIDRD